MKSYPMIAVLAVVIAVLLLLDAYKPSALLYQTEYEGIDSLRTYRFVLSGTPRDTKRCWRFATEQRVLLYIPRDSTRACPQAGDTVIARTRIRRGGQIGGFNYGLYLRRQGIIGTAYAGKRYRLAAVGDTTAHPEQPLQQRLYHRLADSGLSGDELATTGALTLGYKEDLDPELKRRFQVSGAAHVLAVSGLHTGIIYFLLTGLLTLGGRVRPPHEDILGRGLMAALIIAVMWGYAWLTGLTPSVVRCVVMVTLVELGKVLYRNSPTLNTIAAAAVLILLVRPLDLWSISFQLSFAATAAIVIFAQDLGEIVQYNNLRSTPRGLLINKVIGTVIVSLAAQLGTLPVTLYTFGRLSNYFLLTNLMVLPLATALVPCGLASVALGGTLLGKIVGYITFGLAWLMNHAVGWIESLPGSDSEAHISLPMAALLYAALAMGWLTLHKSLWWLAGVAAAMITFCILYTL